MFDDNLGLLFLSDHDLKNVSSTLERMEGAFISKHNIYRLGLLQTFLRLGIENGLGCLQHLDVIMRCCHLKSVGIESPNLSLTSWQVSFSVCFTFNTCLRKSNEYARQQDTKKYDKL